jgi:hypothetical protein
LLKASGTFAVASTVKLAPAMLVDAN